MEQRKKPRGRIVLNIISSSNNKIVSPVYFPAHWLHPPPTDTVLTLAKWSDSEYIHFTHKTG